VNLSRRDFIHAGCGVAAASLVLGAVGLAEARFPRGAGQPLPRVDGLNLNVGANYLNLAKSWVWLPDSATPVGLDGYPTQQPSGSFSANGGVQTPPDYSGPLIFKWTATAGVLADAPFVAYSGYVGAVYNDAADGSKLELYGTALGGAVSPELHFAFGYNIQGMANNGSGLIRITAKTNFANNAATGQTVVISGQTGQAAATGTWTITAVDSTHFDLQGSAFNAGDPWVSGGQAIYINFSFVAAISSVIPYSGFSNFIFCKDNGADLALIQSGQISDTTYLNQVKQLRPKWLRFMDVIGVQASAENDIAYRCPVNALSYNPARRIPAYQATAGAAGTPGAITRTGSDVYTCPNPSASGVGAYADGEIVQGTIDNASTGYAPTLNVGGRGAKPIGLGQLNMWLSGSAVPTALQPITLRFSATWLNSGSPYDFTFTPTGGEGNLIDIATGMYNAMIADAVLAESSGTPTGAISFRNSDAVLSAYPRSAQAGRLSITYMSTITDFTINVGGIFPGELFAEYATFRYSKLTDSWEYFRNFAFSVPYEYFTELANAARAGVWYTLPVETSAQYASDVAAYFAQNLTPGLPYGMEVGNENWNFGLALWGRCVVYGCAMGMYPNNANLPNWSFTANRFVQYMEATRTGWTGAGGNDADCYGMLIGWVAETGIGQNFDIYALAGTKLVTSNSVYNSYGGLGATAGTSYNASGSRPVDYADASGIAYYWGSPWWGGSAGEINPIGGAVGQNAPWLQASKDYANGSTSTAFASLVGQFTRTVGIASFTASASGTTLTISGLTGTITANGTEFVSPVVPNASVPKINYKINSGSGPYTMQDSATFSNVLCTTCINSDYMQGDLRGVAETAADLEDMLAQYSRPGPRTGVLGAFAYESGPQFGLGGNLNAGTNGVAAADISPLATKMTSLGWDVSPYTVSGTNDRTEAATQVIQMVQAWKNDDSYRDMITTYFYAAQRSASPARVVVPSQYGYAGSNWGYFPNRITDTPYKNYDAAVVDGNS
jgi:hypothetical protein